MNATAPTSGGLFRGWQIVAAGFVCTMLAIGGTTYTFGLFVSPLSEEFGMSRADVNTGFIFLLVGFALWSPLVGRLLDRLPARLVMSAGAVSFFLGFAGITLAPTPLFMGLAILGPVAFGAIACGALAANTVTSRWFLMRRGRAMGVLAVSTSAGGFVLPPLVAVLLDLQDWRTVLLIQGAVASVLMLLLVQLLVRDRPESVGLAPDGADPQEAAAMAQRMQAAGASDRLWRYGEMLRNRNFWLIGLGVGLLFGADQALLASIIPFGEDAGFSTRRASLVMSCLTFSAIGGKLLIGYLADRIEKRWLFCGVAACHVAFLIVLLSGPSWPVLMVASAVIGVAIGGAYPLWMTLMADCFGSRSFGSVMGAMSIIVMPLSIISVRFIGEVFDRTGNYDPALLAFVGAATVSALLVACVRARPQATAQQTASDSA